MPSFFNFYWNPIGLSLSRLKGLLSDTVPFSLAEILVWTGLFFCLLLAARLYFGYPTNRYRMTYRLKLILYKMPLGIPIVFGPLLLLLMASGQNATGWCPAPTSLRKSLVDKWEIESLSEETFRQLIGMFETKLINEFNWNAYVAKTDGEILRKCNQSLDTVMRALNLNRGRTVRRIKNMTGLTRLLGLSYGGPAMHDILSGEVAIVNQADNPVPRYWRYGAICHETAHAKGFNREIDAEILTLLAMLISGDSVLKITGYMTFLQKSGESFLLPEGLKEEQRQQAEKRREVRLRQPLVRWLTKINETLGIRNSPEKYGYRSKNQKWNPHHPYFATVIHLIKANTLKQTGHRFGT